jgi:hypothetical protein
MDNLLNENKIPESELHIRKNMIIQNGAICIEVRLLGRVKK